MSREAEVVYEAIDRWERGGLVDPGTAATLRQDAARHASSGTRRLSQYLLAMTGGAALLIAGGIFLDWAWPLLDRGARAAVLAIAGVIVVIVGVRFERTRRWLPASYLLQTSGLGLLLGGFGYSEGVWADQSPAGVVVGVLSLATPILLAPRAMKRSVVMPAVHLAMSFGFLAVFLDRATSLSGDAIVWILDAVLFVSIVGLVRLLATDPHGERHPWALNAFVMAMFAGFFLVAWTGFDVLDLSDDAIYALDAWLALCVGLTLWGLHRGPVGLRRDWFGQMLGYLVLAWIPFGFYTAYEALNGPPELSLLFVGGAGVVGFVYGNSEGIRLLMGVSTFTFILSLWVWAVDRGGALGGVAALLATAGLLFWVSGKTGDPEPGADRADPAG